MQRRKVSKWLRAGYGYSLQRVGSVLLAALIVPLGFAGNVFAATSSSTHYMVNETEFGAGGDLNDCSTSYCAKSSVGDTVDGSANSTNYSAVFGFNTNDQPLLEVIATNVSDDMGVLGTDKTGTAESTVKIRSYLSDGYVLQITGNPIGQGVHNLNTPLSPTASSQGHEQFGLNLVANTTPSLGASPVQVPSSSFSYGGVTSNYSQANKFMYNQGDIVALSNRSTGETDYTLSFIANISSVTPAGQYSGAFSAVVVPTY